MMPGGVWIVVECAPECPVSIRGVYMRREQAIARRDAIYRDEDPCYEIKVHVVETENDVDLHIGFARRRLQVEASA